MREPLPAEKIDESPLAALANLLRTVAASGSLEAILDATLEFLQRWQPAFARIIALHADAHGRPRMGRLLAEWKAGQARSTTVGADRLHPLTDFPLVAAWDGRLAEPVFLADIASEPRLDEQLRGQVLQEGHQAAVLLPLYVESYGGWQGVLKIFWAQPHPFSATERDLYKLLMTALSMHIGGLISQKRLSATLGDLELLHHISSQLNVAGTFDDALRVLLLPAPAPDEAEVVLGAFENDASGQPSWLRVISQLSPPGKPTVQQVGMRYYLPELPFAKLYMSSPDSPLLISDIATDSRVDELSRSMYARVGARSTLIMALTMHERWVGLLNIVWPTPREFSEREHHLYKALAKHAALRLDHTMIVERLRSSLQETRRQGSVLSTVLNNVPVGIVLLEAPSGRAVLSNPAAAQLLGRRIEEAVPPEGRAQSFGFVRVDSELEYPSEELPGVVAMRTGTTQSAEFDVLTQEHGRRSLDVVGVPMRDARGTVTSVVVVISDVTARKRAEEERRRLQEEALRTQAAALAERSSPLIPITDDILVLPLIGSIDAERGHQVLDTVLEGASRSQARVAIIDITGVRTVDTQAAAVLTNASQALRLLGVIPVLTGIKAEVAQTLIGLGIGLTGIVTRSTLQAGIQYALNQLGKKRIE
ncbi:MAG TPA: PAS domain S-box protein [Pseudomonadota bacterium]|nr:PAS domain S-box protein [Pseudomonadota bacterium]